MPPPSVNTQLIRGAQPGVLVQRKDIDVKTPGQALITRMISSAHFDMQSTGVDAGTGDVTFTLKRTGVAPGKYNAFTVDEYGRILSAWSESRTGSGSSASGIDNQYASRQDASFWISGPARIDGSLQVASVVVGTTITAANMQLQSPLATAFGGTGVSSASASTFFAGPAQGHGSSDPSFRLIAESDLPKIAFSKLYSTPTTLAGYGITDAFSEADATQAFVMNQNWSAQIAVAWLAGAVKSSDGFIIESSTGGSSTSNKLYNVSGELFWNGTKVISDDFIDADFPLFYSTTTKKLRLQFSSTNLRLTAPGVLETIQDIHQAASPTFASVRLTSLGSINTIASAFTVVSNFDAASQPSANAEFKLSLGDSAAYSSWTPVGSDDILNKKVLEFTSFYGVDSGHLQLVRKSVDASKTNISLFVDGFIETIQKNGFSVSDGGIKTGGVLRLDNGGNGFLKTLNVGSPTTSASAFVQLSVAAMSVDSWGLIRVETPSSSRGSATSYVTPLSTWTFGARDDNANGIPSGSWFIGDQTSVRVYGNASNTWITTTANFAKSLEIQSFNEAAPANKLFNLNGTLYWNGSPISNNDALYEPKWSSGNALQYYRGDRTLATLNTEAVPESGTNQYFTQTRARTSIAVAGNPSLGYDASSGVITLSNTPTFANITISNTPVASTDAATVAYVKSNAASTPNGRQKFVVSDANIKDYELSNLPINNSTVRVLLNGLEGIQAADEDYTVSGTIITLNASVVLTVNDKITVLYTY